MIRAALCLSVLLSASALAAEAERAPPGGQVVNDNGLVWRITVPEGWSWQPVPAGEPAVIGSAGTEGEPAEGQVICRVMNLPGNAGKAQADLNAETRKGWEEMVAGLMKMVGEEMKAQTWTDATDFNGITRVAVLGPEKSGQKVVKMVAVGRFDGVDGGASLTCMGPFPVEEISLTENNVLKELIRLTASFEPL